MALLSLIVCVLGCHIVLTSAGGGDISADERCERRGQRIMDRAWITTIPQGPLDPNLNITLYYQIDACWKCTSLKLFDIPIKRNCTTAIDSRYGVTLDVIRHVNDTHNESLFTQKVWLNEHGEYHLDIQCMLGSTNGSSSSEDVVVNFITDYTSVTAFLPIYVALTIYIMLGVGFFVVNRLYRWDCCLGITLKFQHARRVINRSIGDRDPATGETAEIIREPEVVRNANRRRLSCLDAFRGLSLVIMIFVNYGGGGYWFFNHSYWNGLTVADLVFPWFVWITGASISLALGSQLARGATRLSLTIKILRRTVILFALGVMLGASDYVDMTQLRIPGVLQRIAISYCVVSLVHVMILKPGDRNEDAWWSQARDLVPYWPEWIVMASFLTAHLLFTFHLPVKGCPRGYLGPGGLHDYGKYEHCTGGAAGLVDRYLFGDNHIYQSPTCQEAYHTRSPFDPEGALGTLTSIFMCFLGLQAGKILIFQNWRQRILRWMIWSLVLGLTAGILCKFSQNDGWIPLNKNLWSASFVLALSSMAFALLTVFYLLIDVFDIWSGAPFTFPGMNSILIYACHEVLGSYFPVAWMVPQTHASQLALDLWGSSLWTIVAYVLHRKRIYLAI